MALLWTRTRHPAGPNGVASKLKGPKRSSHAESEGLQWLARRRFSVSSACGMSRSHRSAGKVGAVPARMDRKWALNVRIARSAAFRRCTCGGTSWKVHPFDVIAFWKAMLASLSRICIIGLRLALAKRVWMSWYAAMRCASCLFGKGRTRMAFVSAWRAIMMYWFPLRARGWKRPVSSVNILFSGMEKMSMAWGGGRCRVCRWAAVRVVDRMCCCGWAIWPWMIASAVGQYLAIKVYVRPGQDL